MLELLEKYGYTPDEEQIGKRLEMIAAGIDDVETRLGREGRVEGFFQCRVQLIGVYNELRAARIIHIV